MSSDADLQNISVSDFMSKNVRTIRENETMKQASKLMYQNNIGSVVVLKESNAIDRVNHDTVSHITTENKEIPTGIVTERDIARMVGHSAKFFSDIPVSEVMSKPVITVSSDTSIDLEKRMNILMLLFMSVWKRQKTTQQKLEY